MNTALTRLARIMAIQTCNWKESMFITTKLQVAANSVIYLSAIRGGCGVGCRLAARLYSVSLSLCLFSPSPPPFHLLQLSFLPTFMALVPGMKLGRAVSSPSGSR